MTLTKLALLLALAIGGLALCDARPYYGRGLLAIVSDKFTCPGKGVAYEDNNRGEKGELLTCAGGSYLCQTGNCAAGDPCKAQCKDGRELTVILGPSGGTVTVKDGGETVVAEKGQYKGCDAYCEYVEAGAGGVPLRLKDLSPCGLSHADFCYSPCRCDKDRVVFFYDGEAVKDQGYCPGASLPDKTKYTAVDNCGKTLAVTATDSPKYPEGGPCGVITRTLSASCRAGEAPATKAQKFTYGDSDITFTGGCPVEGSSKCVPARRVTPVLSYVGCVFKAEYKLENACGAEKTKTVTSCGPCTAG